MADSALERLRQAHRANAGQPGGTPRLIAESELPAAMREAPPFDRLKAAHRLQATPAPNTNGERGKEDGSDRGA
jgi:hypothetical protein